MSRATRTFSEVERCLVFRQETRPIDCVVLVVVALISTFTFVNMAPNFTKVVGPSVDVSPFYYLYWVPLSFLAICFILGLFVGQFQAVFTRRRQR